MGYKKTNGPNREAACPSLLGGVGRLSLILQRESAHLLPSQSGKLVFQRGEDGQAHIFDLAFLQTG